MGDAVACLGQENGARVQADLEAPDSCGEVKEVGRGITVHKTRANNASMVFECEDTSN